MKLTCIICPMGCEIDVTKTRNGLQISGNSCPRGAKYAAEECVAPVRTLTTVLTAENGKMVPVKSAKPIPKESIINCMRELRSVVVPSNARIGDTVAKLILDTTVDIIVTKNIEE